MPFPFTPVCLFAEFGWEAVLSAVAGALVAVGGAAVGWYVLIRDKRFRLAQQEREMTVKERNAANKQRREEERTARDEYRELYTEVKDELRKTRVVHYRCERRLARVEAALLAANIPLPPYDDDEGADSFGGKGDDGD